MDNEYSVIVTKYYADDKPMVIGVDKIGGGTLGHEYTGAWECVVYDDGERMFSAIIQTGMPKTHAQAAYIFADFWSDMFDEVDQMELYDRLCAWSTEMQRMYG